MKAVYADQTDIFDPAKFTWQVHVVGLGGIGSALIFPLIKLGVCDIHVWDRDDVEPHNIPAQLVYRPSDIGTSKAAAIKAFAERQEADCTITVHEQFVTADSPLEGVVISGVDNMAARQEIWQAVQQQPWDVPLYMDGRIGGEKLQLLTLNPSDFEACEKYGSWLFGDDKAAELPCAARTVIHPPTVLAGLMVTALTLFAREEVVPGNTSMDLRIFGFMKM